MLRVNGVKEKYCFRKDLRTKNEINFSYAISSEHKEKLNVTLTSKGRKIYEAIYDPNQKEIPQAGKYYVEVEEGELELCFYPLEHKRYFISFDLLNAFEDKMLAELGSDGRMKDVLAEVRDIKKVFMDIEQHMKFKADGKFNHYMLLEKIINTVKNLSLLKLGIYFGFSLFQIIIIRKFFGTDKRVSTVQGAFSDGL